MSNINSRLRTEAILNKYNLRAKKAFGQNFLIDDNVLKKTVEISNISNEDLVIEIGPGIGNLTEYMKDKNLLLIEIDEDMLEILNDRFSDKLGNITIINKDILKINIDEEIEKIEKERNIKFKNVKVVANLPYYITSPIILKILKEATRISSITVMVQEEVADRIIAKEASKEYGVLSLMVNFYADSEKVINVPPRSFIPSPMVNSAVVMLKIRDEKYNVDKELFETFVKKAFGARRKKLLNSLYLNNFNNMSKEEIEKLLIDNDVDLNSRAEEISLEKYIQIISSIV